MGDGAMSGSASSFKRRIRDAVYALAQRRSAAEGVERSGAGWRSFDRTRKALAGGRLPLAKKIRLGLINDNEIEKYYGDLSELARVRSAENQPHGA